MLKPFVLARASDVVAYKAKLRGYLVMTVTLYVVWLCPVVSTSRLFADALGRPTRPSSSCVSACPGVNVPRARHHGSADDALNEGELRVYIFSPEHSCFATSIQ